MAGTAAAIGTEGADQVGVGCDVVEPVEGDRALLDAARALEVQLAAARIGTERVDQVRVARDIFQGRGR